MDDPEGSGDFLPETLDSGPEARLPCLDDATQPGFADSRAPGGPTLPSCFRRLSDPLLHSPSDETASLVHLEDLERDALLEEAAEPTGAHTPARPPQDSPDRCEKEVKKKLDFGSPKARSGSLPQVEEMEGEEALGAGRWGRPPPQLDKSLLNRENLNNNNSKRSCPDDFEVGRGPAWRAEGGGSRPASGPYGSVAAGCQGVRVHHGFGALQGLAHIPACLLSPTQLSGRAPKSISFLHKM